MEPGIYNFAFSLVLPILIPTSFEHKIGSIKYTVTVNVDRLSKFDYTFKVLFTIMQRVDLNNEPTELRVCYFDINSLEFILITILIVTARKILRCFLILLLYTIWKNKCYCDYSSARICSRTNYRR